MRRVFDRNGDLYKEDFSRISAGNYDVIGIIYEGVGSSATLITSSSTGDSHLISINEGEMPAFIVNQDYFVSPAIKTTVSPFLLMNLATLWDFWMPTIKTEIL